MFVVLWYHSTQLHMHRLIATVRYQAGKMMNCWMDFDIVHNMDQIQEVKRSQEVKRQVKTFKKFFSHFFHYINSPLLYIREGIIVALLQFGVVAWSRESMERDS